MIRGLFALALVLMLVLPATAQTPQAGEAGWTLNELVWGIPRLKGSPYPLTPEQAARARRALQEVLDSTRLVEELQPRIRAILDEDQWNRILELHRRGELAQDPVALPPAEPGKDPLASYVVELLKKRAQR